jgi:hypothetical protein
MLALNLRSGVSIAQQWLYDGSDHVIIHKKPASRNTATGNQNQPARSPPPSGENDEEQGRNLFRAEADGGYLSRHRHQRQMPSASPPLAPIAPQMRESRKTTAEAKSMADNLIDYVLAGNRGISGSGAGGMWADILRAVPPSSQKPSALSRVRVPGH